MTAGKRLVKMTNDFIKGHKDFDGLLPSFYSIHMTTSCQSFLSMCDRKLQEKTGSRYYWTATWEGPIGEWFFEIRKMG